MYHFEIKTNLPKLEKAHKALTKAQEHYETVKEVVLHDMPTPTENKTILCKKCGKRSKVTKVRYADYYWYERPHGCMGGDMWHHGGILIECPKCEARESVSKPHKYSDIKNDVEYNTLKVLLNAYGIQCEDYYGRDR